MTKDKTIKKSLNQVHGIATLAFIIPFLFLISYSGALKWLTFDEIIEMTFSISTPFVILFYIVFIPFAFKKYIEKLYNDSHTMSDREVRKKRLIAQLAFILSLMTYPFGAYVMLMSIDFPTERIGISIIFCYLFDLTGPIPCYLFIHQKLDNLFKHVSIDRKHLFIGISTKIRFTNLFTTLGSLTFLLLGMYMVVQANLDEKNILHISMDELITRLSIVVFISGIFIIIPILFLGSQITKQVQEIEHYATLIANGDLRESLQRGSSDELGIMTEAVNTMQYNFRSMMSGIQSASNKIEQVGEIVQNSSSNLAKEGKVQVTYTADMSNAIEEMATNIAKNANKAEQCDQFSSEVGELAQDSSHALKQTVQAINGIVDKVKIINEIANQTNLLAINATIEASSAGEYGKGFAVVAKEIRSLADKCRTSAVDINEFSQLCLKLSSKTENAIDLLKPKVEVTSNLSEEISIINKGSQSKSIEINEKISHLRSTAEQNSIISEQLSVQSVGLSQQVFRLNELIEKIKV